MVAEARAADRLQLVGAERLQRRDADKQHGRHGDRPAATGNRINKTGEEAAAKSKAADEG